MPSHLKDIELSTTLKESHIFFNQLLHELFEEIYDLLSPVQFKDYVISQRVIRWKLVSTVEKIKKSFDDLLVTHSSEYGENVVKYTSEEATSSLNLLKEIVAKNKSGLDEKIIKQVEKSEMLSSISLKISLPTLEKFLDNTKLLPRFHLDSLENFIKNNIFEEGETLDRANETLLSLKRKKEEIKSSYLESKKKRELLKKKMSHNLKLTVFFKRENYLIKIITKINL